MCAAFHGLLWPTYAKFANTHADADAQVHRAAASQALDDADIPPAVADGSDGVGQALGAADEQAIPHTAQNARYRAKGLEFSLPQPMGIVWIIRGVMEPWRHLMARYLSSSGSSFDRREQAKEAQSILQGSDAPLRSYRLLSLADLGTRRSSSSASRRCGLHPFGSTSQRTLALLDPVAWPSGC